MSKIPIKKPEDIEKMKVVSCITAQLLREVKDVVVPGASTESINSFIHKRTLELGAHPCQLNYKGFPKSVCVSINDVICHGIPSPFEHLKAGDIVNVDVSCVKDGFHGDASCMYYVGGIESCSKAAIDLVETTKQALYAGIDAVKPHGRIGDIGHAIESFISSTNKGYGIVREYTGHGLGRAFHEPPQVLHFGKKSFGDVMLPGMTFTIEPMINAGSYKTVLSKVDGWTVRTADGSLSAQWEHTVLVTETGYEILTPWE